jgi:hypothetical protein
MPFSTALSRAGFRPFLRFGVICSGSTHSAISIGQTSSRFMSPANEQEMAPVLTCWTDIAQYVGKGVRTVQRWERELGFPVRRTKPRTKSCVFAVPGEIDAWVQSQQFPDGELDSVESERTALFRTVRELRSEIRELRSRNRQLERQLALDRARVSGPKIA